MRNFKDELIKPLVFHFVPKMLKFNPNDELFANFYLYALTQKHILCWFDYNLKQLVSFSIEANYHLRNKVIFTIRFISGLKNFDSKIFNGIKKNTVRVARRYSKVLGALAGKASILHPGIGGIMDIVGKIAGKVVLYLNIR